MVFRMAMCLMPSVANSTHSALVSPLLMISCNVYHGSEPWRLGPQQKTERRSNCSVAEQGGTGKTSQLRELAEGTETQAQGPGGSLLRGQAGCGGRRVLQG